MKIACACCIALFAVAAQAREPELPVPPIPPPGPLSQAAPVPSPDPVQLAAPVQAVSVTLDSSINHRTAPEPGFAYSPGARYQLDNDRRFMLPGVLVRVPLP